MVTVLFFFTSIMLHVALDAEYRFCWLVVHAAKVISTAPMIPEPVASTPMCQILLRNPMFPDAEQLQYQQLEAGNDQRKDQRSKRRNLFMISVFANRPQSGTVAIPAATAANNCGHAESSHGANLTSRRAIREQRIYTNQSHS